MTQPDDNMIDLLNVALDMILAVETQSDVVELIKQVDSDRYGELFLYLLGIAHAAVQTTAHAYNVTVEQFLAERNNVWPWKQEGNNGDQHQHT